MADAREVYANREIGNDPRIEPRSRGPRPGDEPSLMALNRLRLSRYPIERVC
jgi:hypothetical protein